MITGDAIARHLHIFDFIVPATTNTPATTVPATTNTPATTVPATANTPVTTVPATANTPVTTVPATANTPVTTDPVSIPLATTTDTATESDMDTISTTVGGAVDVNITSGITASLAVGNSNDGVIIGVVFAVLFIPMILITTGVVLALIVNNQRKNKLTARKYKIHELFNPSYEKGKSLVY